VSPAILRRVASTSHVTSFVGDSGVVVERVAAPTFSAVFKPSGAIVGALAAQSAPSHGHTIVACLKNRQSTSIHIVGQTANARGAIWAWIGPRIVCQVVVECAKSVVRTARFAGIARAWKVAFGIVAFDRSYTDRKSAVTLLSILDASVRISVIVTEGNTAGLAHVPRVHIRRTCQFPSTIVGVAAVVSPVCWQIRIHSKRRRIVAHLGRSDLRVVASMASVSE
jgi:hypothetical protein